MVEQDLRLISFFQVSAAYSTGDCSHCAGTKIKNNAGDILKRSLTIEATCQESELRMGSNVCWEPEGDVMEKGMCCRGRRFGSPLSLEV